MSLSLERVLGLYLPERGDSSCLFSKRGKMDVVHLEDSFLLEAGPARVPRHAEHRRHPVLVESVLVVQVHDSLCAQMVPNAGRKGGED